MLNVLVTLIILSFSSNAFADVHDADGLTPLMRAAGQGDSAQVETLLKSGASVFEVDSKMGISVLHKAIYSGDPHTVDLILKSGANINIQSPSNGDTALHDALYFKRKAHGKEIIAMLLKSGASLSIRNRAGLVALDSAKLLKDQESIDLIQAELDRRYSKAGLSLMTAVRKNSLSEVQKILKQNPSVVNEVDEQGFSPLLWASREGMLDLVNYLLSQKADPNQLDHWMGANSGHKAAFWGRTEVMKVLVTHGLNLNVQGGYNGYTALHDAVSGNHNETAKVLINAGANLDLKGHDGKTVLDIAKENHNRDLTELISKCQKKPCLKDQNPSN